MNKALSRVWICAFLGYGTSPLASADQEQIYQKTIDNIAAEISTISRQLNSNKALLKTEEEKLADIDQNISKLSKDLNTTNQQIALQQKASKKLELQIEELNETQEQNKTALAALVRQRYVGGTPSYLKMVVNQQNPYAVGRLQNYYHYFSQAQHTKLLKIRGQIAQEEQLKSEKKKLIDKLLLTQQRQKSQQKKLGLAKEERSVSVNKLSKKVAKNSEKLSVLKQDRKRLNNLLKQLVIQAEKLRKLEKQRAEAEAERQRQQDQQAEQKSSTPKALPPIKGGFVKQQGRLKYPVKGTAKYRYGSRLQETGMRAQGTFFNTNGGQPVSSIFRGGVLFSGYLKGYGLLLIVDHGDDHISLYGHNEVLYKNVGDLVETNEVVAKSGVSGGLNSAGLYFEIRRKAEPVNPANWCR